MPKLIVVEGPDRVGKTTIIEKLRLKYKAKTVQQPNGSGTLGFLRNILKEGDMQMSPFARQLLHTVSHINDMVSEFDGKRNIIMDRCHISASVYGKLDGLTDEELTVIHEIHASLYNKILSKLKYQVFVVLIDQSSPFGEKDSSYYENKMAWSSVRDEYLDYYSKFIIKEKKMIFCENESVTLLSRDILKDLDTYVHDFIEENSVRR